MNRAILLLIALGALTACSDAEMDTLTAPEAALSENEDMALADAAPTRTFDVTVENLTSGGQHFTPPLVATHRGSLVFFREGRAAGTGIQQIAENGNLEPMIQRLEGTRAVSSFTVAVSGEGLEGPLAPGESVTVGLTASPGSEFVSFASMLICTNDGFTGVSGAKLPDRIGEEITVYLPAYDAGTEINTQSFADLVPPCPVLSGVMSSEPGSGMSDPALAENGVIHLHEGILGYGDLIPAIHGWMDPVARLTVKRTG
ncbi:MAG: spondin domain-containing protein [Longimicrobiales bacterium]